MKSGFTLLELLVVLTIITILAAIATVRLLAPYRAARLADTVERLVLIDYQTRAHARGFVTAADIVFDLDRDSVYMEPVNDGNRQFAFRLPRTIRFVRLLTAHLDVASGDVRIHVSARGTAPTYAVCIGTKHTGAQRWLLVSGVTGRAVQPKDEEHVQKVLKVLQPAGFDAD